MSFAREKRLLLCAAAGLVAWPLPLNQALEWGVLALFLLVVALCARRAARGAEEWLSVRALNLLGLAYLPVLAVDLATTGRVQLVRPILHLTLFGLAAKLASLRRERDKWQAWIGIFFLFLAAMSTSTHPSVVLYLVAFLALATAILVRFVHLHVVSSYGAVEAGSPELRIGWFVAAVVTATVLLAAPLFALLPRIRTPFAYGPGSAAAEPGGFRAGFTDEMSLDGIGRIRENPEIALRLRFRGRHADPAGMRLKASAYDEWEGRSWRRVREARELRRDRGSDLYRLAPERTEGSARIVLEPLRSRALVVPTETVAVALDRGPLGLDAGGALLLPGPPPTPVEYEAELGRGVRSFASPPPRRQRGRGPLDPTGVTPRMRTLAADWAGEGRDAEQAGRIERQLLTGYDYTLELVGRGGEDPLESFLFETRRGHCEYFASAMVLLLRARSIPARVVTGFYGAEWSPWERAWIVRQSNAHAWVEAWIDGEGWRSFDPTPPSGRPVSTPRSLAHYFRQGWEAVAFRWDRWVISYDFQDQVSVLGSLRESWDRLWDRLFARREESRSATRASDPSRPALAEPAGQGPPSGRAAGRLTALVGLLAAAAVALWLALRRREPWTATRLYRRARGSLSAAGLEVPESLAPLALAELARREVPAAAAEAARVVDHYVREAFAGEALRPADLEALRAGLRHLEREARHGAAGRRRAARRRSRVEPEGGHEAAGAQRSRRSA